MPHHNAYFISFEGGEAVGKSSLIKMLYHSLCHEGYDVMLTREPGGTPYSEIIRNVIFKQDYVPSPMTELLLMFAARRDHIENVIAPALKTNKIILCDRFVDSSYVYQAHLGGVDSAILDRLCADFVAPYAPDQSYFIHVKPETAIKRIQERGIENRNDDLSLEALQKLNNAYDEQAKSRENIMRVSNDNDIMDAYNIIFNDLKKRIRLV